MSLPAHDRTRALIALLLIAPAPTIGVIAALAFKHNFIGKAIWMFEKCWLLALPVLWHLLVDRQPLSASPARRGGFAPAAAIGVATMLIILAAYGFVARHFIDREQFRTLLDAFHLTNPAIYIGLVAYWILLNSLLEEYVYRWFIFRKCETLMGGPAAVVASAAIFVVHHAVALSAQVDWWINLVACAGIFIGGAIWSLLYLRYRSVWPCYLAHAFADVGVFLVGAHLLFA